VYSGVKQEHSAVSCVLSQNVQRYGPDSGAAIGYAGCAVLKGPPAFSVPNRLDRNFLRRMKILTMKLLKILK